MNTSHRNVKERLPSCRGAPASACQAVYPLTPATGGPKLSGQVLVTLGLFVRLHLYFMGRSTSQLKTI
jgi:hypothetical protein